MEHHRRACARLFAELTELGGKLYLAGGYAASQDEHFKSAESIEVYDPATAAWSTLVKTLPVPAADLKVRSIQGRLLLFSLDRDHSGSCRMALVSP